jgi:RNA polymerase sigma-70 factor (ECF subfamily)
LLRAIGPQLRRYVARVTGDVTLADDVVQDTLIAIVRKIGWLSDASLFRAWAYRIASRDAFRALKKQRRFTEPVEEVAIADVTSDPWQRERLLASLDRLSPASRAVITLHYLEEMSLAEVAAVLDLSIGTVKSRLAYGLSQLRRKDS